MNTIEIKVTGKSNGPVWYNNYVGEYLIAVDSFDGYWVDFKSQSTFLTFGKDWLSGFIPYDKCQQSA